MSAGRDGADGWFAERREVKLLALNYRREGKRRTVK